MGRPLGAKNKDKPWADALRIVANREGEDSTKRLMRIAEKCFAAAEAGDMQAIKEIGDRLDGKPAQESTLILDDKREPTDWTTAELDEIIHNARKSGDGEEAQASGPTPAHKVH